MINRILIVDDEPLILTGLSQALHKVCGFKGEVRTVVNGREAIEEVSLCSFDICFLDINLPDINGLIVMKEIKEVSPKTKVVIMTASFLTDEMKSTIEDNASLLIPKPFDLSVVKAFIDKVSSGEQHLSDNVSDDTKKPQRPHIIKTFNCSLSILDKLGMLHLNMEDDIFNVSDAGMSIRLNHPLAPGDVVSFNDGTVPKTGIVKWSTRMTDDNYSVGIEFI
ncbi:MAG: response regulator [Nitrospirae bacterium]|nr:response regulator [Nitrospirota bacterium]